VYRVTVQSPQILTSTHYTSALLSMSMLHGDLQDDKTLKKTQTESNLNSQWSRQLGHAQMMHFAIDDPAFFTLS
jgi:hypothetical protein